jgi:hypothetical protein
MVAFGIWVELIQPKAVAFFAPMNYDVGAKRRHLCCLKRRKYNEENQLNRLDV